MAPQLSTEPGVGQVSVFGSMPYAARVQINPASLAAKGLGLEDVRNALVGASVNRPKGAIEGARSSRSRSIPTTSCTTPRNTATS